MAIHKFQVGQSAMYNPPARYFRAVSGTYKVLRQLPAQDGELTYRIIDAGEMQERSVRESELSDSKQTFHVDR